MPRSATTKRASEPAAAAPSKGLDRSLTLLEILAEDDGATLSDIALRAGVPASTAHRILMTLEAHKFVSYDDERGLWFIGVRAFEIGNAFLRNRKLVETGRAVMRRLMEACGESVNLAIADSDEVIYVSQVESHAAIRAFHRPGSRGPMHALAVGKVLLAALDRIEAEALLQRTGLPRYSEHTITDPGALFAELETTRSRGWSTNRQEHEIGMSAVAAPVYNEHAEVVAALSITGPTTRMDDARLGELGPMVKRAAAEFTELLGGRMRR